MKKNNAKIFLISWCNRQGCCSTVACVRCARRVHKHQRRCSDSWFNIFRSRNISFRFLLFIFFRVSRGSAFKVATRKTLRRSHSRPIIFCHSTMCVQFICAATWMCAQDEISYQAEALSVSFDEKLTWESELFSWHLESLENESNFEEEVGENIFRFRSFVLCNWSLHYPPIRWKPPRSRSMQDSQKR